ncbi:hypothetical protein C8J56DRAFT_890530 [Mycena floridula]|nr:hypothetical protein C8J56DRAFT_890530 [Mycena floridula]
MTIKECLPYLCTCRGRVEVPQRSKQANLYLYLLYPYYDTSRGIPLPLVNLKVVHTIYVPYDSDTYPFALVIYNGEHVHNHLIPFNCIASAGIKGTTVQKVDQAMSTKLLLDGKTPAEFDIALMNSQAKWDILASEKAKKFPAGTGIEDTSGLTCFRCLWIVSCGPSEDPRGALCARCDLSKSDDGKADAIIIVTFKPSLFGQFHHIRSFEADFTFKRVLGLHELEVVAYSNELQHVDSAGIFPAMTIARFYTNSSTTETYECIYDNLQKQVEEVTGEWLLFQRLTPGGKLIGIGADILG